MKLIFRIILITSLTYLLSLVMPWWILFAVTFLFGFLLHGNGINAFISGFLGVGLLWMIYAWYLDIKSNAILSDKLVSLFPFEDPNYLIIITGLIGGISGGFGCMTGNSFRQIFLKKKTKSFYN